ncbi:urease accessory protein ureF [Stappia sp. 22II-S9-Z10]|nr:urease accessory protein ureF [Stappia sp. 22II-S9-Z10]
MATTMAEAAGADPQRHMAGAGDPGHHLALLLTWFSPAFPIGAFSYSHGLETLFEKGGLDNAAATQSAITTALYDGSGQSDAIIAAHAWRAARAGDAAGIESLSTLALALSPSRERREETLRQGNAFAELVDTVWSAARDEGVWSAARDEGVWSAARGESVWSAGRAEGVGSAAPDGGALSAAPDVGASWAARGEAVGSATRGEGAWSALRGEGAGSAAPGESLGAAARGEGGGGTAGGDGPPSGAAADTARSRTMRLSDADCPLPVAIGAAGGLHGVPLRPLLTAALHAFAANLVSAAVRLVPLGQTDGQRITAALLPVAAEVARRAEAAALADIRSTAIGLDICAMAHETQHVRLFRS